MDKLRRQYWYFSGTPSNSNVGSFTVKIIATDSGGLSVSDEVLVTVNNINDAPTVETSLPDKSVAQGLIFPISLRPIHLMTWIVATVCGGATRSDSE